MGCGTSFVSSQPVCFLYLYQYSTWCNSLLECIPHIGGLVQERRNSIAKTLGLRLSCTNPSIYDLPSVWLSHCIKHIFIIATSLLNIFLWYIIISSHSITNSPWNLVKYPFSPIIVILMIKSCHNFPLRKLYCSCWSVVHCVTFSYNGMVITD